MKKIFIALIAFLSLFNQLRAEVTTGQCGDNVIYLYNHDTHHMTIRGSGPMYDYDQDNTGPFYALSHHMNSLSIEEGVTHIGNRAFWGCYALGGQLELPASVTSIGHEAFDGCSYLTKLVMGTSVVTIGDHAFTSCWSLEGELVLPDCLETIGDGAFHSCKKLSGDLVIPHSVKSIGRNSFSSCEGLSGNLFLGSSLETIGERAFEGLNLTGTLDIPAGVTSIGNYAFAGCKLLIGEVVVPEGVTVIEDGLFRDCSGITGITLRGQVTHIGNSAFSHCSALTDFVCYATTPPDATEYHVFDNIPLQTVYVPAESVDLYRNALVWKDFKIQPIGGSGIEGASADENVGIAMWGDQIMVSSKAGCLRHIALFDVNGVEVLALDADSSAVELSVASLPSGVYLVKVLTSDGGCCRKMNIR